MEKELKETREELEMYRNLYYSCKDKLKKEREMLGRLLEISRRIKWSPYETAVWFEAEKLAKTFTCPNCGGQTCVC